jgi:hypothetical protein
MPSVSVEAGNINSRHRLVTIPARQQISVAVFDAQSSSSASSRPTTPEAEKAVDIKSIKNELPPSLPLLPAKLNDIVEPDELAQMVCDLLSDQVHLAFDSFTANGAIVEVINYLHSSSVKSICSFVLHRRQTLPSSFSVCLE